jgi:hypothetical protein
LRRPAKQAGDPAAAPAAASGHYVDGCADPGHIEELVHVSIVHSDAAQGPVGFAASAVDENLSSQDRVGRGKPQLDIGIFYRAVLAVGNDALRQGLFRISDGRVVQPQRLVEAAVAILTADLEFSLGGPAVTLVVLGPFRVGAKGAGKFADERFPLKHQKPAFGF